MADPKTCAHSSFDAQCAVGRLTEVTDGPVTGYTIDVQVRCTDCGLPFRFLGVQAGSSPHAPRVSIDGHELRAPIEPAYNAKFKSRAFYQMPQPVDKKEH